MTMQCFCNVFAAGEVIRAQFDNKTEKMTISGTLPSDAKDVWVNIEVFDAKTGELVWLGQTTADENLEYETEIAYETDLDYDEANPLYKIKLNYMHEGAKAEQDVYYTANSFTQLWKDIAKASNAAEIESLITAAGLDATVEELGFDDTVLTAAELSEYIYDKISNRTLAKISDCKKCVREAIIFGEIAKSGSSAANEYIALENAVIDEVLALTAKSDIYKLYAKSSDKIKSAFASRLFNYYDTGAEFKEAYTTELLIMSIKNADNMLQITAALDTCGETVLGTDYTKSVYAELKETSKKEKFAKILKSECKQTETAAQLKTAFASAGTEYKRQQSSGGSSSGGSSGGGFGGSSMGFGSSVTTITNTPLITDMFTDLDTVAWAKESINGLAKLNIVSGVTDNEFLPNRPVTREEFVKLLTLAFDIKTAGKSCDFDDVRTTDWFYPYVAAAKEEGIANGISETLFGTGSYISREDMAVMVYRAAEKNELVSAEGVEMRFADAAEISEYAKDAVSGMSAMGIINGREDGRFDPDGITSRAEAAKVIYAVRQLFEQKK